jgi:hypothetical protein
MRRALLAGLPIGLLVTGLLSAGPRDWSQYPAIVETTAGGADIYAIGDAHSDYVRLALVMKAAGLIDNAEKWSAGHAVLITTGDMIDKGPRALDVIRLLKSVREQARTAGGKVIILAGNHEAEFLADPAAPKGTEFAKQLKAAGLNPAEVGQCKGEIGEFLCSLSFGAKVDGWFFSHAANTGARTVAQLEADIRKGIDKEGYATKQLIGNDSLLEARLDEDGPGGKPWLQERMPSQDEKALLAANAAALGVAHIVEGHKPTKVAFLDGTTRNPGEMFQRFGLLFLIDTGMSEGVGNSHGAVLRITKESGETATAICPDRTKTVLWTGMAKQDIGHAAPCK